MTATETKPTNNFRTKSYVIIERGEGRAYETIMRCMRFSEFVRGYRPSKLFSVDFDNLDEDVSASPEMGQLETCKMKIRRRRLRCEAMEDPRDFFRSQSPCLVGLPWEAPSNLRSRCARQSNSLALHTNTQCTAQKGKNSQSNLKTQKKTQQFATHQRFRRPKPFLTSQTQITNEIE